MRKYIVLTGFILAGALAATVFSGGWEKGQARIAGSLNCSVSGTSKVFLGKPAFFLANVEPPYGPGSLVEIDYTKFRFIPAGTFLQGVGKNDPCSSGNEIQFYHTLTKNLLVMENEIQGGDASSTGRVSWFDAILFANKDSKKSGLIPCYYKDAAFTVTVDESNYQSGSFYCNWNANGYRLPSEGEWEYFCRAGTDTTFSIDEPAFIECAALCNIQLNRLEAVAWFCSLGGDNPHPSGLKGYNPWNLKDVHGNVSEWCWDWFGDYPNVVINEVDFHGPDSGLRRVVRGGAANEGAAQVSSFTRRSYLPVVRDPHIGFRLVRNAPEGIPASVAWESDDGFSEGSDTIYEWDFGDGSALVSAQNITHVYAQPGVFQWKVNITKGGDNCSSFGSIRVVKECFPPEIKTPLQGQIIPAGFRAVLRIDAQGTPPLHYKWYEGELKDRKPAPGGRDQPEYTTPVLTSTTKYWVNVENECGSEQSEATVSVIECVKPSITSYPLSYLIPAGKTVKLSVKAEGLSPLKYTWYEGESGDTANPAPGGTNSRSYTTPPLFASTKYWVRIDNLCGTVNSETASVTVYQCQTPIIQSQPADRTIDPGSSATLTVTAFGDSPLNYTWYQGFSGDVSALAPGGKNTASYSTPDLNETAIFWVRVTNPCGYIDSRAAMVKVNDVLRSGSFYAADSIAGNLRLLLGGDLRQGSGPGDPCNYPEEKPFMHLVNSQLVVMETEVTRQMWTALKTLQNSLPKDPTYVTTGQGQDVPVNQSTWLEAVLFANLFSLQKNLQCSYFADESLSIPVNSGNYLSAGQVFCDWNANGYRLPTEGEWEYFCRAGTTSPFSAAVPEFTECDWSCTAGRFPGLENVAWYCANAGGQTHPAGQKLPNPWGLKDLHGNVNEWCWDWYGESYPAGSEVDYRGPVAGNERVIRGGSRGDYARSCRSAARSKLAPQERNSRVGFRLVRQVEIFPKTPASLKATGISCSRVDLSWSVNTSLAAGYRIERKKPGDQTWQEIGTTGEGIFVYSDTAVTAGTSYLYRVRAFNANGNSPYSNEAAASTFHRDVNFTLGGYLGAGSLDPGRAIHIKGPGAVFRMDRPKDTAAFMITRTSESGDVWKSFVVGVNAAGANNGSFVINDLGASASGGGAARLTVDSAGKAVFTAQVRAKGFITLSSRRFKQEVRPLRGALTFLLQLRGYRFNWIASGEDAAGFMVEDLTPLPQLPGFCQIGQPAGVEYARLTALLLESLKEQQAQLEALKQERSQLQQLLEEYRRMRHAGGAK